MPKSTAKWGTIWSLAISVSIHSISIAAAQGVRMDQFGDPLPPAAQVRLGTIRWRHAQIQDVACSPDGKWIASAGSDDFIRVWETASGKEVRSHRGHGLCFRKVAYSPDGKLLIGAGGSADARLYIWDAETGKELQVIRGTDIYAVAISHDSKRVAWVSLDGSLGLWDRSSTKVQRFPLAGRFFDDEGLHSVSFSPDGKRLVAASRKKLSVFDVEAGKTLPPIDYPNAEIVRYSPDGKLLAVGGDLDEPIDLLDAETGKKRRSLEGVGRLPRAFEFSPDGKTLVSQGNDHLLFSDVATGKPGGRIPLRQSLEKIDAFTFSRDGKVLAYAQGSSIVLVDQAKGALANEVAAHTDGIGVARFLPGEKKIVTTSWDQTIGFWDAETGKLLDRLHCGDTRPGAIDPSPDGTLLAWAGRVRDTSIRLYNMKDGKLVRMPTGKNRTVDGIRFSLDGRKLATAARSDPLLRIWDIGTGKTIAKAKQESGWGNADLFSLPDGKRLVACSETEVIILDNHNGKILKKHEALNRGICVSADGKLLAIAPDIKGPIRICELETGKGILEIKADAGIVALALSPDGSFLAFAKDFDPDIAVWDLAKGKLVQTYAGHKGYITSLSFSRDGRRLLSSSIDGTAMVWERGNGK